MLLPYRRFKRRHGFHYIPDHIGRIYFQGVDVQIYALVGPAASAFHHSAPILERGGDEGIWRDHREGVVPVADLDGVEGDFLHVAVGAAVWHLDPVAELDHIVLRELHPGHKAEYTVLEYEHKHCS